MGVTQHSNGSDTSTAISNLLLVTGNYMRPGTGAYPLRGHNNVQGASDHGAMPNTFPGYQKVDDPEIRAKFERGWGVTLPTSKGLDNHQMVDAIHDGRLRSMYVCGEEMSVVDSNINYVMDAFKKLEFFVVQDVFFSVTCQFADVVLPASPSLEKEEKALMAGIPIMAAVGAPSSLAVATAERSGMTLIGFLRNGRFNVYTGSQRILGCS